MLTRIELRNRQGEILNLPFEDIDNGFGIAGIEGLDPVEAVLVSSGFANKDGEQYYAAKRAKRNIKLMVDILPDFANLTAKSLRNQLYKFLMPKAEVTLRFYEDLGSFVDIVGRVESFDAPLFVREPVATASIVCFDPDFFDPTPFTKSGQTVAGSDLTTVTIPYLGTVEAGFVFELNVTKTMSSFSIILQSPGGTTSQMDFAESLVAGDKITISTVSGSLGVSLTRAGTLSSILWGLSPLSPWAQLEGVGDNKMRVTSSALNVPWSIKYVTRLGGL